MTPEIVSREWLDRLFNRHRDRCPLCDVVPRTARYLAQHLQAYHPSRWEVLRREHWESLGYLVIDQEPDRWQEIADAIRAAMDTRAPREGLGG